jgi:hypothetical protein
MVQRKFTTKFTTKEGWKREFDLRELFHPRAGFTEF